jgi:hypothetical protein
MFVNGNDFFSFPRQFSRGYGLAQFLQHLQKLMAAMAIWLLWLLWHR